MLLLHKERGPSSNRALQQVRRILGGVKAGHAGTLDPGAEGLLLVCLGEATKLMPFLSGFQKEYEGEMKFGAGTDTHDAEGKVTVEAPVEHLGREIILEKMKSFLGEIRQVPPMYSAVKVGGERLYRMARRGEEVLRESRAVEVSEFALLRWESPLLRYRVRCGGGTYIRSLCRDLARECGTEGHMTSLTRTAVGPFRLEAAVALEELRRLAEEGARLPLIPPAEALPHLPAVLLGTDEAVDVRQGKRLSPPPEISNGGAEPGTDVKLVDSEGRLVAVVSYEGPDVPMPLRRVFTRG
jgi:tRNA pseudouridine55 synthase